jgi:hypothetical protein
MKQQNRCSISNAPSTIYPNSNYQSTTLFDTHHNNNNTNNNNEVAATEEEINE